MDINILYELALGALFDPWLSAFKSWSESHYFYYVQTKWRKPGNVSSYTSEINSENLHAVQLGPCMGYFGLYLGIIEAFVPERKGLHLPKISSQSSQWGMVFYWIEPCLTARLMTKEEKKINTFFFYILIVSLTPTKSTKFQVLIYQIETHFLKV